MIITVLKIMNLRAILCKKLIKVNPLLYLYSDVLKVIAILVYFKSSPIFSNIRTMCMDKLTYNHHYFKTIKYQCSTIIQFIKIFVTRVSIV